MPLSPGVHGGLLLCPTTGPTGNKLWVPLQRPARPPDAQAAPPATARSSGNAGGLPRPIETLLGRGVAPRCAVLATGRGKARSLRGPGLASKLAASWWRLRGWRLFTGPSGPRLFPRPRAAPWWPCGRLLPARPGEARATRSSKNHAGQLARRFSLRVTTPCSFGSAGSGSGRLEANQLVALVLRPAERGPQMNSPCGRRTMRPVSRPCRAISRSLRCRARADALGDDERDDRPDEEQCAQPVRDVVQRHVEVRGDEVRAGGGPHDAVAR